MKIKPSPKAQEEFAAAYEEYADAIFRHCYFRARNRERALELMQESFMNTWEYISAGNTVDNVRAFLYRTANNLVINDARRKKLRREESLEQMQEDTGFDITGEDGRDIGKHIDAAAAKEVLNKVDEPYRTVLIMRFIDELKPREIAELIGESANVVSVRINRGLERLRTFIPDA